MSENSCCYSTDSAPMSPVDQCLARMQASARFRPATETLPLSAALDRVLAEDLIAPRPVPPHINSAMDGYAIAAGDLERFDYLEQIGQAFAGHPFAGALAPGQCIQIMTGAPLPEGADTVVMRELAEADGSHIRFQGCIRSGENIRAIGEDLPQGACALSRGIRLTPAALGLAASLGFAEVPVFRQLRVALCSTGDEINPPGQPLPTGGIYDSNRFSLQGMLQRLGAEVIDLGIVADTPEALESAMRQGAATADVLISSGGVSVGEADYTRQVLEQVGQVEFWRMAIRPGRPMAFGQIGGHPFFGLPGNPVAVMVAFLVVVQPILRQLMGEEDWQPLVVPAQAREQLKGRLGRLDYLRGQFSLDHQGSLQVRTTGAQGSGILSSMVQGNCLIRLDSTQQTIEIGETVQILPFSDLL